MASESRQAERFDASWLNATLRGVSGDERLSLRSCERTESTTILSHIVRFRVEYESQDSDLPTGFLLKLSKAGAPPELGDREVNFYRHLSARIPEATVRCFRADFDKDSGESTILLEDMGGEYREERWPLPPSLEETEAAVTALASVHGGWWGNLEPLAGLCEPSDAERIAREEALIEQNFAGFLDFLDDRLSLARRRILEDICAKAPMLWRKRAKEDAKTLRHGDAHLWNFLLPKQKGAAAKLIDWQNWHFGHGTDDLAYMIALHWYPERRARWEMRFVRLYQERVSSLVPGGLSWKECWRSYRKSAVSLPLVAMEQWGMGIAPFVWWPHLERSMCAFEDLGCADFLDS